MNKKFLFGMAPYLFVFFCFCFFYFIFWYGTVFGCFCFFYFIFGFQVNRIPFKIKQRVSEQNDVIVRFYSH